MSSADLEQQVAELEQRVELLESMLVEPGTSAPYDKYDSSVLAKLAAADDSVYITKLQQWYREAGVRTKRKIENRIRHLASEGLIESTGTAYWRYSGPETLGDS